MKGTLLLVGVTLVGLIGLPAADRVAEAGATAPTPASADLTPTQEARLAAGLQVAPFTGLAEGSNPYLSYLPDLRKVDFAAWAQEARRRSAVRAESDDRRAAQAAASPGGRAQAPIVYRERERPDRSGVNDTAWRAEKVAGFGLGAGANNQLTLRGTLAHTMPTPTTITTREDNGSIPLATDTGVRGKAAVRVSGRIGDGPFGDSSGDFDWFKITARPGETIVADTSGSALQTMVAIVDASGEMLDVAFDFGDPDFPPRAEHRSDSGGTYYVLVSDAWSFQEDPFDSGSGSGAAQKGRYTALIGSWVADRDAYLVHLDKGDVLGGTISGAASGISVQRLDATYVMGGADIDLGFLYPTASPLPFGGNASLAYVAEESGWYAVIAESGTGSYAARLAAYRPGGESDPSRRKQQIFLDFDGATIDTRAIFGDASGGRRTLSPLRRFLRNWGLTDADLRPLMATITATVEETLRADLIAGGTNPDVDVRITSSATSPDEFGKANVSRVIVGGTIDESGIETIGLAQYIDPGNFSQEDTAIVLLDILGSPRRSSPASLNRYLEPPSDRVAFVGQAIGNIVAHEAGHYVGNFHTNNLNDVTSVMDSGGAGYWRMFGTGPDRVGGTADDHDTDFVTDRFSPWEGLRGLENTPNVAAWAFSARRL